MSPALWSVASKLNTEDDDIVVAPSRFFSVSAGCWGWRGRFLQLDRPRSVVATMLKHLTVYVRKVNHAQFELDEQPHAWQSVNGIVPAPRSLSTQQKMISSRRPSVLPRLCASFASYFLLPLLQPATENPRFSILINEGNYKACLFIISKIYVHAPPRTCLCCMNAHPCHQSHTPS